MTTPDLPEDLKARLQAVQGGFLQKLPLRMQELESAWQSCLENPMTQESWAALHRVAHMLAGSSGSFGFPELGLRAREIEDAVRLRMEEAPPSSDGMAVLNVLIERFVQWVHEGGFRS